ncbi:hypothetical protein V6Z12_D12G166900 [Gossypium hirsutum]
MEGLLQAGSSYFYYKNVIKVMSCSKSWIMMVAWARGKKRKKGKK